MDIVERLWVGGDIEGTLRKINAILTERDGENNEINKALLLAAYIHFQRGKLNQSNELLKKVQFESFELTQWIVENNSLVIKYLEDKDFEDRKTNVHVSAIQGFASLLEKIQGLPCSDVLLLELHVSFNFGLAVLATNATESSFPGGYQIAQVKMLQTIERVLATDLIGESSASCGHLSVFDKLRYFCEGRERDRKIEKISYPLGSLCWLLSLFWLMDFRVEDAQRLVGLVIKFCTLRPETCDLEENGLIFKVLKDDLGMPQDAVKASQLLTAGCHLVLCYGSFLNHDKQEALKQCNLCLTSMPEFLPGLLIKGLILYENGDYHNALGPLQQLLTLSTDEGYKATALNMLGCACAKLGKPHTALAKFRESFASSTRHVGALFNVGMVYHQLETFDLEISLWKHLFKILSSRNSHTVAFKQDEINITFVAGITARILGGVISNDRLLVSSDVYCLQSSDGHDPQLNTHVILYKIAHNCFQQKRYSEAAEHFLELLALLNDKPVDVQKVDVPSLAVIFKETAEALRRSGRHGDALTVCEKILVQGPACLSKDMLRTAAKRSQENLVGDFVEDWFHTKSLIDIMLCKADALIQLQRPVEAHECYERILEVMNKVVWSLSNCDQKQIEAGEPDHKRQKTEIGSKGIHKCGAETKTKIEECERLKAVTFNKQGLLLKSLGRRQEALLLFAQSVSCQPDCVKYHYDHASLLFDMGKDEQASHNWMKFRKRDQQEGTSTVNTTEIVNKSDQLREIYFLDEDPSLYADMDARAVQSLHAKSENTL